MYLQLQLMEEMVQHRVYIAMRQVPVSQQKVCGIKSCLLYRTNRYINERHQKLCVRCHLAGTSTLGVVAHHLIVPAFRAGWQTLIVTTLSCEQYHY